MISPRLNSTLPQSASPKEQAGGDDQNAEDAHLGEDAGQQRAGGGRGHRVGLGQPDMQREHARLGAKARQDQGAWQVEGGLIRLGTKVLPGWSKARLPRRPWYSIIRPISMAMPPRTAMAR